MVRDFYERVKIAAKTSIIYRTFITEISPVILDDLSSGYNIADNLTLDPAYTEAISNPFSY